MYKKNWSDPVCVLIDRSLFSTFIITPTYYHYHFLTIILQKKRVEPNIFSYYSRCERMVTQMFQLRSAQPASYSECKLARSHVRDTSVQIRALDYIYMLPPNFVLKYTLFLHFLVNMLEWSLSKF